MAIAYSAIRLRTSAPLSRQEVSFGCRLLNLHSVFLHPPSIGNPILDPQVSFNPDDNR